MTVILRYNFSPKHRALIKESILTGGNLAAHPDLEHLALSIAEELPSVLRRGGLPDTLETRSKVIDIVMDRMQSPLAPKPAARSYRKFAYGGFKRKKGKRQRRRSPFKPMSAGSSGLCALLNAISL